MNPCPSAAFGFVIGKHAVKDCGAGLVVIDGIADLVSDVNNLDESSMVIQKLMKWTEELDCHIITVIHSNYGSEKPTGHLGSYLEKKAETQIQLEINEIVGRIT